MLCQQSVVTETAPQMPASETSQKMTVQGLARYLRSEVPRLQRCGAGRRAPVLWRHEPLASLVDAPADGGGGDVEEDAGGDAAPQSRPPLLACNLPQHRALRCVGKGGCKARLSARADVA